MAKKAQRQKQTAKAALTQTPHYDYIDRPRFQLPNGARVAVTPYINIEHFPADIPGTAIIPGTQRFNPDPLNYGWRDYGNRVGLWRMMELMDACGMRGTVCLNSDIICEYPRIIKESEKRKRAWIGHGINNAPANFISGIDIDKERKIIGGVLNAMEKALGRKTKGWLSPFLTHTNNAPNILAEFGVGYLCDYTADDHPFPFKTKKGSLISVPYTVESSDIPAFQNVRRQLRGVRRHDHRPVRCPLPGGRNQRPLHADLSAYVLGGPAQQVQASEARFRVYRQHEKGWLTTGDEINDWYGKNYLH